MDLGLQDRTTDLKLGEPRNKIWWVVMWSACVYKHKTERIRYLSLCSATFWFIYDFTDIDECKGNHSCHLNATCTNTLGSHVCECHPGYTGNGRNCTGEFNFPRYMYSVLRVVLHDTLDYSTAPFSRVAEKLENLSSITRFNLRLHPTYRCRKNRFFFYLEKSTFE